MTGAVVRPAPAKVNLALHVTGRRADGYHLIESLVVFTRFGDRVTATEAAADSFEITGRYAADLPLDTGNLALKARDALRAHAGAGRCPPVAITLEKNLPIASGVGGGSSDAAATLKALAALWGLDVGAQQLARIALPLGADLPMCLAATPLLARGIGEDIEPLRGFPQLGLVLVNPGVPVATADVFRTLASRENPPLAPLPPRVDFHSLRHWLESSRNDLEAPARSIQPVIGEAIRALDRAGSGFSRMSGSGATCFGLFETGNVAKRAAAAIRERNPGWFVAATRSMASEDGLNGQD
ncbi:MAG: 4-(cytidine 5'-diphospho)-2-C-methyl-D-erythritol kinase [Rhizobiaceae bacterium]|nr:4-(cytidine 5'-diphospho)-2-C-methyl-D-erythritol kinase [Rhizobiaceae bacterium]